MDKERMWDEIEHLKSELKMEKENEDRLVREWQRANNEVYGLQRQVAALIDNQTRLKAEVVELKSQPDPLTAYLYAAELAKDDIKKLKAEVEKWEKNTQLMGRQLNDELEEVARLKAECQARQAENSVLAVECDSLKAEVERLTKAGDEMAKRTEFFQKRWDANELCQEVEAWNAAKEGKQS